MSDTVTLTLTAHEAKRLREALDRTYSKTLLIVRDKIDEQVAPEPRTMQFRDWEMGERDRSVQCSCSRHRNGWTFVNRDGAQVWGTWPYVNTYVRCSNCKSIFPIPAESEWPNVRPYPSTQAL